MVEAASVSKQGRRNTQPEVSPRLTPGPLLESNAKALQILDGAQAVFLEFGYEGTSIDQIARRAQVSKPTVYNHFADKRALFTAMVRRECFKHTQKMFELSDPVGARSIEPILRQVATRYLKLLLTPWAQSIFRIAIAESQRFPEIGQAFYDAGPTASRHHIVAILTAAIEHGELVIDDVALAADQFLDLCRARVHLQCALFVIDSVEDEEIERLVASAVSLFVRGYRARD